MAPVLFSRALMAAVVTVVLFGLKAGAIASGRDPFDDPLVNVFFFAGIAALLLTFAVTGAALSRRRGTRRTAAGVLLGLLVGVVGSGLIAVLATTLLPRGGIWVLDEINLWVIALLTLTTVLVLRSRLGIPGPTV